MQVILIDEDKRGSRIETNSVDIVICIGKVSRYMKREYIGRFRRRFTRI